ncbi:metal ABC transporter substrate-binding protein [Demequina sp. TTPB684]|uniref:metal ABC transporter substrate-binding protein n=1 Tax=unclassified Demequina TaxID=2620311 RepID=UPI001CF4B2D1|nr:MULTISPECIES: metal ABC transporter substrate-binding protein [unclassified Demequina]MCB2413298.1 metal ABC transporter substrate-binding protein [Demequina sp. TTPB684]UPU88982.1 metal ABC transporter substrate-binding protein [Demequina sp. TMPB413]
MKTTSPMTLSISALGALALAACSSTEASSDSSAEAATASLNVAAAFYPLQYVAEGVGGAHVAVSSLTPAGVEPHDVELSPATVRDLSNTDLVLFIDEFQPAVEEAISSTGVQSFDAASVIEFAEAEEHADEEDHAEEDDHGSSDPHFWLDPTLLADYAVAVGDEFATLDPDNADDYTANAAALADELRGLDEQFSTGLAMCERTDMITAHEAFGYLARAYDLDQIGIAGLEPDTEPSPARMREIHDIIEETGATTVFTEELVSPKVAESIAQDAGVEPAILDPIESVASDDDYRSVMLRNLDALRAALACE